MTTPQVASSPFDSPNADIILRSGGDTPVDFHLHRFILSLASSFFRGTFTLPQPAQGAEDPEIPVIDVSESSATLDVLFRLVYPVPHPPIESLDDLGSVLEAASKYDMLSAIQILRRILITSSFLQQDPFRVFAIAARYDFEEEARLASKHTLNTNLLGLPLSDEMKHISAHSYHRLLVLHQTRGRSAVAIVDQTYLQCQNGCSSWWTAYKAATRVEVLERPTTSIIFTPSFLQTTMSSYGMCNYRHCNIWTSLDSLRQAIDGLPDTI